MLINVFTKNAAKILHFFSLSLYLVYSFYIFSFIKKKRVTDGRIPTSVTRFFL